MENEEDRHTRIDEIINKIGENTEGSLDGVTVELTPRKSELWSTSLSSILVKFTGFTGVTAVDRYRSELSRKGRRKSRKSII